MRGAPDRIRTCDLRLRRPTLYPLSYRRMHEEGRPSSAGGHGTRVAHSKSRDGHRRRPPPKRGPSVLPDSLIARASFTHGFPHYPNPNLPMALQPVLNRCANSTARIDRLFPLDKGFGGLDSFTKQSGRAPAHTLRRARFGPGRDRDRVDDDRVERQADARVVDRDCRDLVDHLGARDHAAEDGVDAGGTKLLIKVDQADEELAAVGVGCRWPSRPSTRRRPALPPVARSRTRTRARRCRGRESRRGCHASGGRRPGSRSRPGRGGT